MRYLVYQVFFKVQDHCKYQLNGAWRSGGHPLDNYPGPLSLTEVTATLLKIRDQSWGENGHQQTHPILFCFFCFFHDHAPANCGCLSTINSSAPGQNGHHFADDNFSWIFLNENVRISIKISLKFVPKGPIDNKSALVQVMAWRRTGDKPLPEPVLTQFTDAYMRH